MIAVIDYKMGNLRSVKNAFEKMGGKIEIIDDPDKIFKFDKILLPGVGAFGDAVRHLKKRGMDEAVKEFAKSGKFLLGICLGMQLLFEKSYEFGEHEGLGLIEGEVVEFDKKRFKELLKIPHMGWNKLFVKKDTPLFSNLSKDFYLYFVHSFHAVCDEKYVIGKSVYGYEFVSAVCKDNILGIQPHPEKSHDVGLNIIKNFMEL